MRDKYTITDQFEAYFMTLTIVYWVDLFTSKSYKQIIADSLNHRVAQKGLIVYGWVLMSNHLHLIARTDEPNTMSGFLRDFKKFTPKKLIEEVLSTDESRKTWMMDKFKFEAHRTQRAEQFKVWQDGNHPVLMGTPKILKQRLNYIHENPVRQGIVENSEEYLYSSARDYSGYKGLVRVEMI
jgi:putative transposase